MLSAAFAEFRKKTASYLDKVEDGETVVITRHGRPVAEVIPFSGTTGKRSWKRPALRLRIKGISLSRELLADRRLSR